MSWPSFSAFMRDRTVEDPALMCPVRVLWREYEAYCGKWGFEPALVHVFISWLSATEGVRLKTGGQGRLRRMAVGVGLRQEEIHDARNA